jgi:hypothetical protein
MGVRMFFSSFVKEVLPYEVQVVIGGCVIISLSGRIAAFVRSGYLAE